MTDQIQYLGVPINDVSYVFGDNESMIESSSFPYARLRKRHNILSFHYVRSMIAKGFIALHHISSPSNLADILTKHWSHSSVYNLLRPVFHHLGNTAMLYIDDSPECLDRNFQPMMGSIESDQSSIGNSSVLRKDGQTDTNRLLETDTDLLPKTEGKKPQY